MWEEEEVKKHMYFIKLGILTYKSASIHSSRLYAALHVFQMTDSGVFVLLQRVLETDST
jgi:hypothetical protein